jgi:hypothetical protein
MKILLLNVNVLHHNRRKVCDNITCTLIMYGVVVFNIFDWSTFDWYLISSDHKNKHKEKKFHFLFYFL